MKTINLKGVVIEMRRVYDELRDGHNNRAIQTHGWTAKVMFHRGVLNSEPIEIPVQEGDGVGIGSIVKIEMTIEPEPTPVEQKKPREIDWSKVCAKMFYGPHGSHWGCTRDPGHDGMHEHDNGVHPVVDGDEVVGDEHES